MKKYLALFLSLCISVFANAQATDLVVDCQTPGWLSSKINYGDQQTVENLKVTGYLNGTDINFLVNLQSEYKLRSLDLSEANIVKGGEKVYISTYHDNLGHNYPIEEEILEDNVLYPRLCLPFTNLFKISTPNSSVERQFVLGTCINADTVIVNGKFKKIQIYTRYSPGRSSYLPSYNIKSLEIAEGIDSISLYSYNSTINSSWKYQRIVLPSSITKIADLNIEGGNIVSKIEHPEKVSFINCTRIEGDTIFVPQGTSDNYRKSKFSTLKVIREMSIPSSLTLNLSKLKMYKNDAITLLASFTPEDAFYKEIKWESSNESVATVNQYGEISAVSSGTADITVSSVKNPEAKAICTVSVYEHTTGVNISDDNIVVCINETKQLTANTLTLGTTDNEVTWASSDEEIATVDVNGKVTGVKPGSCIIKATTVDGGFEAQCNVTVVQPAETITLNKESTSLIVGKTETLTADILPDNTTDKTILWSSSNINVATIDANGMITAKKAGECTITATSLSNPNVTATCKVTVIQPVTGITLSESTYKLKAIGENIQLTATVLPDDATNKKVNWYCPNNTVCVVSNGNVVAEGYGTAVIIATTEDGGFIATCTVTVEDTSGIIDVKSEHNENLPTYDTMGRKVQELKKGQLYIRQGKKFVLK